MAQNVCYLCPAERIPPRSNFATYHCVQCHELICLHVHSRRRKVQGVWQMLCTECAEKVDQARKNK